MSFTHKATFDILQCSNIGGELDDYFEVDELIALPIQERLSYIPWNLKVSSPTSV